MTTAMNLLRSACVGCGLALALGNGVGTAEEYNPVHHYLPETSPSQEAQRFIVKLRAQNISARVQAQASGDELAMLADRTGVSLLRSRSMAGAMHLMQVRAALSEAPSATLERLRADPVVEFAELDQRRYPHAIPNDPMFHDQWYLQSGQASAVNAVTTWDTTAGNSGVVIAVLDTGVRFDHPDLRGSTGNRLLPGYDFVSGESNSSFLVANDGTGRDPDPSDPGDWVSTADTSNPVFSGCTVENSSWHGTRVAGLLGALTDNSAGVAGMTWRGWILPVRVLGKCGGFDSDILDAMRWAAGLHVDGVPDNPYPARIENLSLGSAGTCPSSYQAVINEVIAAGVLVVISAGNEGGPVDAPANCPGVAAVAGLRHAGTKVGYSNVGREIALSAPAGNCVNTTPGSACLYSIDTTVNSGTTTPVTSTYTDQISRNIGTSFSAPLAAAIGGLMVSVNGNLGPRQLIARLQEGARPFPTTNDTGTPPTCHVPIDSSDVQANECVCTTQTCGAGMASAEGGVTAALRPIATIKLTSVIAPGLNVTLDAGGSAAACGRTVSDYAWTVVSPTTNPPALQQTNGPFTSLIAPIAPSEYTVRVTVTDETGATDFADVTLTSNSATSSAPANAGNKACLAAVSYTVPSASDPPPSNTPSSSSGSHGGGGTFDYIAILSLVLLVMATRPWRGRRSED
jgi:serine protease